MGHTKKKYLKKSYKYVIFHVYLYPFEPLNLNKIFKTVKSDTTSNDLDFASRNILSNFLEHFSKQKNEEIFVIFSLFHILFTQSYFQKVFPRPTL